MSNLDYKPFGANVASSSVLHRVTALRLILKVRKIPQKFKEPDFAKSSATPYTETWE